MYNRQAILDGIEKLEENIEVFEKAISGEREKIKEYYRILAELDRKALEKANAVVLEVIGDDGTK
jgi:hypothetical protein